MGGGCLYSRSTAAAGSWPPVLLLELASHQFGLGASVQLGLEASSWSCCSSSACCCANRAEEPYGSRGFFAQCRVAASSMMFSSCCSAAALAVGSRGRSAALFAQLSRVSLSLCFGETGVGFAQAWPPVSRYLARGVRASFFSCEAPPPLPFGFTGVGTAPPLCVSLIL